VPKGLDDPLGHTWDYFRKAVESFRSGFADDPINFPALNLK